MGFELSELGVYWVLLTCRQKGRALVWSGRREWGLARNHYMGIIGVFGEGKQLFLQPVRSVLVARYCWSGRHGLVFCLESETAERLPLYNSRCNA